MAAALVGSRPVSPVLPSNATQLKNIKDDLTDLIGKVIDRLPEETIKATYFNDLGDLLNRVGALEKVLAKSETEKTTVVAEGKVTPFPEDKKALERRLKSYFELLDKNPGVLGPDGDSEAGEIVIIRDVEAIAKIEKEKKVTVGILTETPWHYVIMDAVKFPNNSEGAHIRIFTKATLTGVSGTAVLPVTADGKIMLCLSHRHTQRQDDEDHGWRWEIPRGSTDRVEGVVKDKHALAVAVGVRETKEETGAISEKPLEILGQYEPNTGCMQEIVFIGRMNVEAVGDTKRDDAEASMETCYFTEAEIWEGIKKKSMPATLKNGQKIDVPLRDGFLFAAIAHTIAGRINDGKIAANLIV